MGHGLRVCLWVGQWSTSFVCGQGRRAWPKSLSVGGTWSKSLGGAWSKRLCVGHGLRVCLREVQYTSNTNIATKIVSL